MAFDFGDVIKNIVGGAGKTVDNSMKLQASSGNQGADNPIQALFKQYANQPSQSFARPAQQQSPVQQQVFDQGAQFVAQGGAGQKPVDSITLEKANDEKETKDSKEEKQDKKKQNHPLPLLNPYNSPLGFVSSMAMPGVTAGSTAAGLLADQLGADVPTINPAAVPGNLMDEALKSIGAIGTAHASTGEETAEDAQGDEPKGVGARLREAKKNPEEAQARAKEENKLPSSVESAIKDTFNVDSMTDEQRDEFFANMLNDPYAQMSINNGDRTSLIPLISNEMTDEQQKEFGQYMFDDPYAQLMLGEGNHGVAVSPVGMSSEDVEHARSRVYPYGSDVKAAKAMEPEDNWFTNAYGYLSPLPMEPYTWDFLTNGTGYMKTRDGQSKWYDEQFNLYDENPNPENKTTEDRRQDNLEDEMRAMSEAQAFMLENPGATNGTYEGNRRMSQGGETGKYAQEYGLNAEDLESMSDTELILNELARNEEFRNNMVKNYGDLWNVSDPEEISTLLDAQANLNNPFLSDYLVMNDNGYDDKRQMTQDLFLDSGMDPVVRTQLLQRIYNQNQKNGQDVDQLADILRRDARGEELSQEDKDYLTQNIMDTYFANPVDFAEWALSPDSAYAIENPFNYADQAAWMGSAAAMNPTIAATIADLGLDASDLGAYLAAGNQLNLGDTWMDRNNGPLTEHWYDYLGQLLNDAGYASEWNRDIAKKGDKEAEKLKKRFTDSGKSHNMGDLLTTFMQNAGDPNAIAQALNIVGGEDMYDLSFGDIPFDLLADYRGVPIGQYGLGTSRYINPKSINEPKEA